MRRIFWIVVILIVFGAAIEYFPSQTSTGLGILWDVIAFIFGLFGRGLAAIFGGAMKTAEANPQGMEVFILLAAYALVGAMGFGILRAWLGPKKK